MASVRFLAMKNRKSYIKINQVEALIEYFFQKEEQVRAGHNKNKAYLLYTLWRTGRRIGEIVGKPREYIRVPGLRPIDFDPEHKEITFYILKKNQIRRKTKGGKPISEEKLRAKLANKPAFTEVIAYDTEFFNTLWDYVKTMELSPYDRIFPYSDRHVRRLLAEASHDLKLYLGTRQVMYDDGSVESEAIVVHPHSFRHGFAMHLLEQKKNDPRALPMLQELLCHYSLNTTKTYLRFNQEDRQKALNEVFGVEDGH